MKNASAGSKISIKTITERVKTMKLRKKESKPQEGSNLLTHLQPCSDYQSSEPNVGVKRNFKQLFLHEGKFYD